MQATKATIHELPSRPAATTPSTSLLSEEAMHALHIVVRQGQVIHNRRSRLPQDLDQIHLTAYIFGMAYRHYEHPEHGTQPVIFTTVDSFVLSTGLASELSKSYASGVVDASLQVVDELMRWSGHLEGATAAPPQKKPRPFHSKLPIFIRIPYFAFAFLVIFVAGFFINPEKHYQQKKR